MAGTKGLNIAVKKLHQLAERIQIKGKGKGRGVCAETILAEPLVPLEVEVVGKILRRPRPIGSC
jgi:hypothetical protein